MPAGLQVWNNGLQIQIDSDYRNLHLTQNVNVVCSTNFGSWYYTDVTFGGVNLPVIALYTYGVRAFTTQMARSGSSVTYRIWSGTAGATIKVLIFDTVSTGASNYGFQVYDSAGSLVFDSSRSYMRVIDVISGQSNVAENMPSTNRSYPGKTVAAALGCRWSMVMVQYTSVGPNPDYMIFWLTSSVIANGSNFQANPDALNAAGPFQNVSTSDSTQRNYNFLVIDVTNMI